MSGLARKLMAAAGVVEKLYVDDVFSTWLRTGTGADTTVTTGIDMTKGYMLWSKGRSGATDNAIYDSARGVTFDLVSNNSAAQTNQATGLKAVSATGHTVGSLDKINTSGATYVDWVFRKAPKFFDVVTYTGDGVAGRQIPHELGIAPGMVIVKCTTSATSWKVYHRSLAAGTLLELDTTAAVQTQGYFQSAPDASTFTVSATPGSAVNASGSTYVAYLFANEPSADGIIQCGSFTTDASGKASVNLGWEPQYVLSKVISTTGNWIAVDSMRGMPVGSADALLYPNLSNAETSAMPIDPTATGFNATGLAASQTYIYLAIRRPNKPPKTGTEVYNAIVRTGTGAAATVSGVGFAPDLVIGVRRDVGASYFFDRLRGQRAIYPYSTSSEVTDTAITSFDMRGLTLSSGNLNSAPDPFIYWNFCRAPGFMDVVCDTGTGAAHAITHNLTKAPELIIRKSRSAATQWEVWHSALAATEKLALNSTAAKATDATAWNSTVPTASQFTVGTGANVNANAATFVTYLFATLTGISKVGSYTGNGSSQTIDCGFSTGARFVLIKRTDSAGDWYVWDTARGIVAANDPHLSLNTTAAEVTTDDSIDPAAAGFVVNQNAATNINVNTGTYIFLAIA